MNLKFNDEIFYPRIGPNIHLLEDRRLLSQAWKKTNLFIREHNWYVDRLELELYSFNIENNLKRIAKENKKIIEGDEISDNSIKPFDVVPVPKSTNTWTFPSEIEDLNFHSWNSPIDSEQNCELELRSIAQVDLKTQVNFTALLMCIAEAVESSQKKISTNLNDLLKAEFYSYGNRLQSIWLSEEENEKAVFQSGSSLLYEQYFKNYKLFLERPLIIARYYEECISSQHKIYIINIDISKFFDSIDTDFLITSIKNVLEEYYENNTSFTKGHIHKFVNNLNKFFNFDYVSSLFNGNILDKTSGLPQGLAASGFLANIYLMEFDKLIGSNKNKFIEYKNNKVTIIEDENENQTNSIVIRDYCRYVDDMRLVIEVNKDINIKDVENKISNIMKYFIEEKINKKTNKNKKITFNPKKFEVLDYNKYYNQPLSRTLNSHRALASGTPTLDDLSKNLDSLKNILLRSLNEAQNFKATSNKLLLSKINTEKSDIKDSSLKKFLATELKKSLDLKDKVLQGPFEENTFMNIPYNQHQSEKKDISKLLIYTWSKDPSLVYLLKIGLEINPSSYNFKSILEALEIKLELPTEKDAVKNSREQQVAFYIIGQVYEIACDLNFNSNSNTDDFNKYNCVNKLLFSFGEKLLKLHKEKLCILPFYVLQNLIIFYTMFNTSYFKNSLNEENIDLERMKPYLHMVKLPEVPVISKEKDENINILGIALIKDQLSNDEHFSFINWFISFINATDKLQIKESLIKKIFQENNKLFRKIFSENCNAQIDEYFTLIKPYKYYLTAYKETKVNLINNKYISLMKIILSEDNPFNQENALLILSRELLKKTGSFNDISLLDIDVKCSDWNNIQNPNFYTENFLQVKLNNTEPEVDDVLSIKPFWLYEPECEIIGIDIRDENSSLSLTRLKDLYKLGMVLRSCIIGDFHFTAIGANSSYSKQSYGFKTTYYSRSFGLNNSTSKLSNKINPITPWLSEFIFYCLRWPYAHFTIETDIKYRDTSKLINERISYQKKIYGNSTDTPMYVYPISFSKNNKSTSLKVGIVQNILPKPKDFDIKNLLYWSSEDRSLQRNHIINICNLIERHLEAYNTSKQNQSIDLLVFPEVSIHENDVDILHNLVRKIKTNIFAGLMYMKNPKNPSEIVNQAIWITYHEKDDKEEIIELYQGKKHPTNDELQRGVKSFRPYQLIMEFTHPEEETTWKTTGSICYDSTDLRLATDLRDITDSYIVSAYNQDVQTFDNMATSLSYHMYQPVILSNIGIYGGSTIQAPFKKHDKLVAHLHGNNQIGIGIFEINMNEFKSIKKEVKKKETKTPPAGYTGRE